MIRKAIIVLLTLGTVGTGVLGYFSRGPGIVLWDTDYEFDGYIDRERGSLAIGNFYFERQERLGAAEPLSDCAWWCCSRRSEHRNLFDYCVGVYDDLGGRARHTLLQIRLFPFMLIFAAYPTVAFYRGPLRRWRRRRRRRKGLCVRCGYDLTGNVSGTCPECGMELFLVRDLGYELFQKHAYPELAHFADARERHDAMSMAWGTGWPWPIVHAICALVGGAVVYVAIRGLFMLLRIPHHSLLWNLVLGSTVPLAMIMTLWAIRRPIRRSLRQQLIERGVAICLSCGYDFTGNVSGVCPECGEAA